MPKPPVDDLMKAITDALKSSGMTVSPKAIKQALTAETKGVVRKAPKATSRAVPKITPKTAAGGAGRKPPKPPKAGPAASAPKPKGPKGPKKPSGDKKMTRAERREMNVAKHWANRDKYLAESSAAARAAKAEKSAANSAAWAKRQDEMEARRIAGREKYEKKKKGNK
jgi:hypothetical protein